MLLEVFEGVKQTNHQLGRVKLYISKGKHGLKDLPPAKSSPLYFFERLFLEFLPLQKVGYHSQEANNFRA